MKKRFILGLAVVLILSLLAGTAWAEETEELPYWGGAGAYATEEEPAQTTAQQTNTQAAPAADPFAKAFQQLALEQTEIYANQALYGDPLMDDLGLILYLNEATLDQDGNMSFALHLRNQSDHNIFLKERIEITVGSGEPQRVKDMTDATRTLRTEFEFSYVNETFTVPNPNMEDALLHIWIVEVDDIFEPNQVIDGREITLPLRFLGDYLTDAPTNEIHLPALNAETPDIEGLSLPLYQEDQFSIALTDVYADDEMLMLYMEVTQPFDTPVHIVADNIHVNETAANNRTSLDDWDFPLYILNLYPSMMPDETIPYPVETVSFSFTVYSQELETPYTSGLITLIFDGTAPDPSQVKPDQQEAAVPANTLEIAPEAHLPVYTAEGIEFQEPVILLDAEGYTLSLNGIETFANIEGAAPDVMYITGDVDWPFEEDVMIILNYDTVNGEAFRNGWWSVNEFDIYLYEEWFSDGKLPERIEEITLSSIEFYRVTGYEEEYDDEGELAAENPIHDPEPLLTTGPVTLIFDGQ